MNLSEVLAKNKASLLAKQGVVGLAVGSKKVGGIDTGTPAVVVFVRKKLPQGILSLGDIVPKSLGDTATDVVEVGDVKALSQDVPPTPTALTDAPTAKYRPIVGGISCARERFLLSGTIGLPLLYKGDKPVLLSNNHVICLSYLNQKPVGGEPVRQPSVADKYDAEADYVAKLLEWEEISPDKENVMDAAIAILTESAKPELLGLGEYKNTTEVTIGMGVTKSGRSSGVNTGTVLYTDAVIQVDYNLPKYMTYTGQIALSPMLIPGDSGSAIVRQGDNAIIALGFAGSDLMSFATPIGVILSRFGLTVRQPGVPVEQALAGIAGKYDRVWGYDSRSRKWLLYVPGVPQVSDLAVLQKGKGYWLMMKEQYPLTYGPSVWVLEAGWNLIGWQTDV